MQRDSGLGLTHWQVSVDAQGIVWAACDRAGESTNALSEPLLKELEKIVAHAETTEPTGLVIKSAKPGSFILGADINEFDQFTSAEEVEKKILEVHAIFARLENLKCPTVATVHGFCLGGGLELAMACDYLIAMNVPDTRLGLPEVKLGIFPAFGGTVRLTERCGGFEGVQLILTGRMLRAGAARKLGVVDELVDEFGNLDWAARRAITKGRKKRLAKGKDALTNSKPVRMGLAAVMRKKTADKVNPDHYPAPFKVIDIWEEHRDNRRRMFEAEAREAGQLMVGDVSRNLRRIYFLTERMKGLGKASDFKVRRVHVVGAGVMGGDIAAWCVTQGMEVTLQDREMKYIEPALKRARGLFKKRLKQRPAIVAAQARLQADVAGEGVARADVVIEAIYEDADAKRALYAELEPKMADHAILATNTSALMLEDLAKDLKDPKRLIGLHFFNPVAKMPLVEVIHGKDTSDDWITKGCSFCSAINRYPLPTKSSPGFLVNRVLAPYLMEAITMHLEGVNIEALDAAAIRFGMPMGPIELADVVGLDVCMKVAETLAEGDVEPQRQLLQGMIDKNHLGKKTGQGFYKWEKGKADRDVRDVNSPYGDELAARLMKPFLAECEAASRDGVVADDDLLDAGIIFGTGFAPFTGGPMNYLANKKA